MAATEILVRIVSVVVLEDKSGGEWSFETTVLRTPSGKTETFGDPGKKFESSLGKIITLDLWSIGVKLDPADEKIEITMSGKDSAGLFPRDIGKVSVILNTPILHGYDLSLRSSKGLYQAKVNVKIHKDAVKNPGEITTITSHQRGTQYNTINDGMQSRLVHICPVIPVPWATGIPPVPVGVQHLDASDPADPEIAEIKAGEKTLNKLVNPALVPILQTSNPEFGKLCARIRITQYRPRNLDLKKLIWKAATDNILLFDGGGGKSVVKGLDKPEIKAYGVAKSKAGTEGRIEVRWDEEGEPLLAVYRVIVGWPRYLYYRANIIKCKNADGVNIVDPSVTPAQVQEQLDFNSVLLWQSGIRLLPDPDETPNQGAKKKGKAIFEITLEENQTFNMDPDAADADYYATILNHRPGVLNLCYIHSHVGGYSGLARDRMKSPAAKTETLPGSPSTSWVFPTGVYPDADGKDVKMNTMGPSAARPKEQKDLAGDGTFDNIHGLAVADWAAIVAWRNTVAHESGHVLGLHHRGSGGYATGAAMGPSYDKVNHMAGPNAGKGHPWDENIMSYSGYTGRAVDFDLIQTIVMRRHPLLKNVRMDKIPPVPPVIPPAPPPGKKPVPAAWLPTMADKTMLQEYLKGKRPGLKHSGYNIGTSGPAGDGVDGKIGPKTSAAIRSFQRDHGGLKADGIYGPKTAAAFDKEING